MNQRATENNLNDEQFATLKDKYIDLIVDSMTTKDLIQYVANDMQDFLDKLSENQVYEEIIYTLDEEMLDDLITETKKESKD
jgi:GH25 family lysozyme M1 (1,4-beta-N-acetylmuramidase)